MLPNPDQFFIITINEINGHEFSVFSVLNYILLFLMSISEIFNCDDFRFNFLMVIFLKGIK